MLIQRQRVPASQPTSKQASSVGRGGINGRLVVSTRRALAAASIQQDLLDSGLLACASKFSIAIARAGSLILIPRRNGRAGMVQFGIGARCSASAFPGFRWRRVWESGRVASPAGWLALISSRAARVWLAQAVECCQPVECGQPACPPARNRNLSLSAAAKLGITTRAASSGAS